MLQGFVDLILTGLEDFVWIILIAGPLQIIETMTIVLQFLATGFDYILFFHTSVTYLPNTSIIVPKFDSKSIPIPFIVFTVFGILLSILLTVFQLTRTQYLKNKANNLQQSYIQMLKMFCLTLFTIFFVPMLFFFLSFLISWLIYVIKQIFDVADSAGINNNNLFDVLYNIGNTSKIPINPHGNPGPPSGEQILNYNLLVEILGVLITLIGLFLLSWVIVVKVIELFFLFLISPIVAAFCVYDDGKKLFIWRNLVINKACLIVATMLGFEIFLYVIKISTEYISNSDFPGLSPNNIGTTLIKSCVLIAIIAGTCWSLFTLETITSQFFGEAMGLMSSVGQIKSIVGLGLGASAIGKKTLGAVGGFGSMLFGKKNKNSSDSSDLASDGSKRIGGLIGLPNRISNGISSLRTLPERLGRKSLNKQEAKNERREYNKFKKDLPNSDKPRIRDIFRPNDLREKTLKFDNELKQKGKVSTSDARITNKKETLADKLDNINNTIKDSISNSKKPTNNNDKKSKIGGDD